MNTVPQDLRYAARMPAKAPGFALVAIATLAIGIGLNTAMFSVVHTVLVKPLPYAEPDRLLAIFEANPEKGWLAGASSPTNFLDWKAQNRTFTAMSAYNEGTVTLTGSDIIRMVLKEAMMTVAIGVVGGLLTAALLTRFLASLVFGIGVHDPITMVAVSLTLVAFALFASYWPARRATQVDPMIALRSE